MKKMLYAMMVLWVVLLISCTTTKSQKTSAFIPESEMIYQQSTLVITDEPVVTIQFQLVDMNVLVRVEKENSVILEVNSSDKSISGLYEYGNINYLEQTISDTLRMTYEFDSDIGMITIRFNRPMLFDMHETIGFPDISLN